MFVGLAFLALIVIATVNTIGSQRSGTLGTGDDEHGTKLPQFAVPDALSGPLDLDANVAQRSCSSSGSACSGSAGSTPACEIHVKGAIRVCDYFNRPLVISFWFTRGADCIPTQDVVDRVARGYRGRVNFLSIDVRDDPADVRRTAEEHGWRMPVGYDRDGAVSDLYGVGACPTLAYAYPGGVLDFANIGEVTPAQLDQDVRKLLADSRVRAAQIHRQ